MAKVGFINMLEEENNNIEDKVPVTAITCTGDRPVQFGICSKIMNRMKHKPMQWIIVDDGKNAVDKKDIPEYATYIRREPQSTDPEMTLSLNMIEAFKHVNQDAVIFIEDDDYYPDDYIQAKYDEGKGYDAIGALYRKYFQIATNKYYEFINHRESITASLMLCNKDTVEFFRQTVQNYIDGNGLDTYFWRDFKGKTKMHRNIQATSIGIKAWGVGRGGGYMPSHTNDAFGFIDDSERTKLKQWIPESEWKWYGDSNINRKIDYVIYCPPYKNSSAGIRALFKLKDMLIERGHKCICTNSVDRYEYSDIEIYDNTVVIYPEIISGNPLRAENVIRYILNHPAKLGGDKTYDSKEMLVAYGEQFGVYSNGELLNIPVVEDCFKYNNESKDITNCYWVGKGKNTAYNFEGNTIEITRSYPETREKLADILKRTKNFYSYDDLTMLLLEATMAGCNVKIIGKDNQLQEPVLTTMYDNTDK